MTQLRFFSLLLLAFGLTACGNDDAIDVSAAVLDIQRIVPAAQRAEVCGGTEAEVFLLKGGQIFEMDLRFSDDQALSQYKIDIHNNFDCHGHDGASAPGVVVPDVESQTMDWTTLEIVSLEGNDETVSRSLEVPQNVTAGLYHFQIQVLAAAGNDEPLANIYSLKIENPLDQLPPQIEATTSLGDVFSVVRGQALDFIGQVTDNRSLSDGGNGVLFLSYTDLRTQNVFNTDAVFVFDGSVREVYPFEFAYRIPTTLKSGDYLFVLGANDGVRNVAESIVFEVTVTD